MTRIFIATAIIFLIYGFMFGTVYSTGEAYGNCTQEAHDDSSAWRA